MHGVIIIYHHTVSSLIASYFIFLCIEFIIIEILNTKHLRNSQIEFTAIKTLQPQKSNSSFNKRVLKFD